MTKSATREAADKVTFTQAEVTSAVALKAPIATPVFTGNVGVGVTPEAWHSSVTAIDVGTYGSIYEQDEFNITSNSYLNASSQETYKNTDEAVMYKQTASGKHIFKVAPSGTADAAISWNTAMTIDNAGIVTKPNQPAFMAYRSGSHNTVDSAGVKNFAGISFNRGNHYDGTNKFTCPVAGLYTFTVLIDFFGQASSPVVFRINGGLYGKHDEADHRGSVGTDTSTSFTYVEEFAANDYVQVLVNGNSHNDYIFFSGYLIG
jgi:hypothetical protein